MFSNYPFLRIIIPFVLGILLNSYLQIHWAYMFGIVLITSCIIEQFKPALKWKYRKISGLLVNSILFLLGSNTANFSLQDSSANKTSSYSIIHLNHLDHHGRTYNRFIATLYAEKENKLFVTTKAFVFIAAELKTIEIGNVLLTNNHPQAIIPHYNPGSFDFASFAHHKGIYLSLFLNQEHDFILLANKKNSILTFLHECRKWIIATLQNKLSNEKDAGLAEALLIGFKEDLDKDLQEQYSLTGISHIIAVSGMHLGLIFSVLSSALLLVTKRKKLRILSFAIILPLLWAFALISGASASVLRSVLVFSLMIWGNLLLKKANSINALFGSGFILLLFQPRYLFDIGFQLSYAAVLSILIYEPILSKCIVLKNKMLKQLWSMVAITLAAQILTTPLVLYHFNQFPVFFLLTNMVVVPLSSIVLLLTILLCLAAAISLPTSLLSTTIHLCIKLMNTYVAKVAGIPNNSLHINASLLFTIGLFCLIIASSLALINKKINSLFPTIISLLMVYAIYRYDDYKLNTTKKAIVLDLKNTTVIVHQHGKKATILVSSNYLSDNQFSKKQLRTLSKNLGVKNWKLSILKPYPAIIAINEPHRKAKWLLFSGFSKSGTPLHHLLPKNLEPHELIADQSNRLWKIREWEKEAQELHLRLHSTPLKGAFQSNCE